MLGIFFVVLCTIAGGLVVISTFEWWFHKYVMHRPVGPIRYPYTRHTLVHHRVFRFDETYHLINADQEGRIGMAWWNGPLLVVFGGGIPFGLAALPFWLYGNPIHAIAVFVTGIALSGVYYGAYEYTHWCMHLPKARRLEGSWIFRRLNGHHLLHHRYMGNNFNVVLPLADWLFGTLLVRAKRPFMQARGPSVPDVQPLPP